MSQGGYRVGVDVGGTFTDLICITPDGQVVMDKTPTTPDDQSVGVLTAVAQLADYASTLAVDYVAAAEARGFILGAALAR